jgi:hypothetical protein
LIVGDKKMNDLKNHKSDYKRLKLRRSWLTHNIDF